MILFRGASMWTNVRAALIGVFGMGMVLVPAAFVYLCVMNEKEKRAIAHFKAKVALCVLTVLFAGALIYILGIMLTCLAGAGLVMRKRIITQ